uniref:UPAR/Ly6 domain-containing protein n=1 Tax=Eptatretus burgeri TaxID=7764 RepID=A0A8C4QKX8_EPTBU
MHCGSHGKHGVGLHRRIKGQCRNQRRLESLLLTTALGLSTNLFRSQMRFEDKMNYIFIIVGLGLLALPAFGLQCKECFLPTSTCESKTCDENQQCFTATYKPSSGINFKAKGCIQENVCTLNGTNIPSIPISAKMECCKTNLCNKAPKLTSTRLVASLGLFSALMIFSSSLF